MEMDDFYDDYVQKKIKSNWRFWLFGFFMRPLYQSYRVATSKPQAAAEFSSTVNTWVQDTLSLTNLRKSFLEGLRKISTRTKIMTAPDQLEEEALGNVGAHCIIPKLEAMAAVSPNPRPSTPKHISATSTPIFTPLSSPAPTPPRTPTLSRRSSRREATRKSHQSRSRSNSPQNQESKPKRRASYRSDKPSQMLVSSAEANDQKPPQGFSPANSPSMESLPSPYSQTSSAASPDNNMVMISSPSESSSQISTDKLRDLLTTMAGGLSKSPQQVTTAPSVNSLQAQTVTTPFIFVPFNITNIPAMVANQNRCSTQLTSQTNTSNLPVAMGQPAPSFLSAMSSFTNTTVIPSNVFSPSLQSSNEVKTTHHDQMITTSSTMSNGNPMMEVDHPLCCVQSFVPIVQSGIISNGTIQHQVPSHESTDQSTSEMSSMDILHDVNDSMFGAMPLFSPPVTMQQFATKSEFCTPKSQDTQLHSVMNENDDDSLMKMLTLDVMDVNSVMDFFNDQKDVRTNNSSHQEGV